jgi:hypothetical protein
MVGSHKGRCIRQLLGTRRPLNWCTSDGQTVQGFLEAYLVTISSHNKTDEGLTIAAQLGVPKLSRISCLEKVAHKSVLQPGGICVLTNDLSQPKVRQLHAVTLIHNQYIFQLDVPVSNMSFVLRPVSPCVLEIARHNRRQYLPETVRPGVFGRQSYDRRLLLASHP